MIRSFAYLVDALFFGLVAYHAMKKTAQQQRYGDEWAHTIVCRRDRAPQQSLRSGSWLALAIFLGALADGFMVMTGLVLKVIL